MSVHIYVEENGFTAMLVTKSSAGVAPEVNIRECVTHMPLLSLNKASHSGCETQRRHHQKSKTMVSVAREKDLCPPKVILKDCIPVGCIPPACWPYLPACTVQGGAWSPGGRLLPGGGIPACTEADPPCEQNSWHTLLKILPCPKLRLRVVKSRFDCQSVHLNPFSLLNVKHFNFQTFSPSNCVFDQHNCVYPRHIGWYNKTEREHNYAQRKFSGESSVLRVRLRVVKNSLR